MAHYTLSILNIYIYLFERVAEGDTYRKRDTCKKEILHPLVYFPNDHNSHGLKPGTSFRSDVGGRCLNTWTIIFWCFSQVINKPLDQSEVAVMQTSSHM